MIILVQGVGIPSPDVCSKCHNGVTGIIVPRFADEGQFSRYAPVQYLEEGTDSSQDESLFAWRCEP